jgi:transposase
VRGRIDWKYLLALELTDSGFNFSVLSEFRGRLIEGKAERLLLDRMLEKFKERKLLKVRGSQRTDSTHILAAVRTLNRLESVGETIRAALNSLATVAPDWLCARVSAEWFERHSKRVEEFRLPKSAIKGQLLTVTSTSTEICCCCLIEKRWRNRFGQPVPDM